MKTCKDEADLNYRVNELSRIRNSVMLELRDLDYKRRQTRILLDQENELLKQVQLNITKERQCFTLIKYQDLMYHK